MAEKRTNYSDDLKWNKLDLYKTEEDFLKDFSFLEDNLKNFKKFQNHILDSSDTLLELLTFENEYDRLLEQVFIYAHIGNDEDTSNTHYQTMFGKVYKLYEEYNEASSYIVPEILKSDYSLIEKYIKENPKLESFKRVLKEVFKTKEHTLSKEEEKILSSMTSILKAPDDIYSSLSNTDIKFGRIKNEEGKLEELSEKNFREYISSSNRNVRKNAFTKLLNTYGLYKNTFAATLASEININNKIAHLRGYKSALHASLFPKDIDEEIYHNLINTVKKNIKPLSSYWLLKKKELGLDNLHIYDTYAPITKETKKKYSIDEAKELLLKSLSVLGEDYLTNLKKSFDEKWIDFCPNKHKRNGAYCTACYNVHPYVLLSYNGTLNDVSTLAHELGHAMHYYYAISNQTYQDYSYSIFVAEVASQVNQILLSKYLIANTTDISEKKYLLDDLIGDFKATIYRQTMFADFELMMHELSAKKEVLTHEVICDKYYDLNKKYYGDNVIVDEVVKYEWIRISHFYLNFYVYQYATAYAASIKIAMDILNNKENAVLNYLEFLKLGCTKTPIDSLKVAGVDMTKPDALKEAFTYFNNLVEELEELMNRK